MEIKIDKGLLEEQIALCYAYIAYTNADDYEKNMFYEIENLLCEIAEYVDTGEEITFVSV